MRSPIQLPPRVGHVFLRRYVRDPGIQITILTLDKVVFDSMNNRMESALPNNKVCVNLYKSMQF